MVLNNNATSSKETWWKFMRFLLNRKILYILDYTYKHAESYTR